MARPAREKVVALYVEQRQTSRQIAALYGVSKTEVLRWLKRYEIPPRAVGRGLDNRGIVAPTRQELERMIHAEHLSYAAVAERYGADPSAVRHWLLKHGLPTSQGIWITRRHGYVPELPDEATLITLNNERVSQVEIAQRYGVSAGPIRRLFDEYGITPRVAGWAGGRRIECVDGHVVRSVYEERVDDWLNEHGVAHTYEPRLPCDLRYRADFLANGWYIEVWGVVNNKRYEDRRKRKTRLYREHGYPLIEIHPWTFSKQKRSLFEKRMRQTLTEAGASQLCMTA